MALYPCAKGHIGADGTSVGIELTKVLPLFRWALGFGAALVFTSCVRTGFGPEGSPEQRPTRRDAQVAEGSLSVGDSRGPLEAGPGPGGGVDGGVSSDQGLLPCGIDTGLVCDDGNVCNGVEVCAADGLCYPGQPLICDDGNPCNGVEACSPASGCVQQQAPILSGSLDPSWNAVAARRGVVITPVSLPSGPDRAKAVAFDSVGNVVVAGQTGLFLGATNDFVALRYTIDATLDTSFGASGIRVTDIDDDRADDVVNAMGIDTKGRIVIAGSHEDGGDDDPTILRLTAQGALDSAFADDGSLRFDLSSGDDEIAALLLGADDGIVVVGTINSSNPSLLLGRYRANGTRDTSFGTNGYVNEATRTLRVGRAAAYSAGSIVVAGRTGTNAVVARFSSSGVLDTSFGVAGFAVVDTGQDEQVSAVAVDGLGRIVVAGWVTLTSGGDDNFFIARLTSNGALDNALGTRGYVLTPLRMPRRHGRIFSVAVDASERIVVAGHLVDPTAMGVQEYAVFARYTSSGALDPGFGSGGLSTLQLRGMDGEERIAALQLDRFGRLVGTGWTTTMAGGLDFATVRLCP